MLSLPMVAAGIGAWGLVVADAEAWACWEVPRASAARISAAVALWTAGMGEAGQPRPRMPTQTVVALFWGLRAERALLGGFPEVCAKRTCCWESRWWSCPGSPAAGQKVSCWNLGGDGKASRCVPGQGLNFPLEPAGGGRPQRVTRERRWSRKPGQFFFSPAFMVK